MVERNEIESVGEDEDEEILTPEERATKYKYYKGIFDKYDVNKTGFIEWNELLQMIKDDEVPKKIVKKIFRNTDRDKNGRIDFNEFMDMLHNKSYRKLFGKYLNIYVREIFPRKRNMQTDYEDQYSFWPPPVMMPLIAVLEVVFFWIDGLSDIDPDSGKGYTSKWLIYNPYKRYEIWRYFTYMFVHQGHLHLLVNISFQLLLGVPLELVHKWRVVPVYFAGVIAGSLGNSLVDPTVYLAGASGGVYALITAHMGTIIMNWKEMSFPGLKLLIYGLVTTIDVGSSIYNHYCLEQEDDIGYIAHFAGAIAGLLMGIWLLKNFSLTNKETYYWWFAFVIYIIWMGTMIIINIALKNYFLEYKR